MIDTSDEKFQNSPGLQRLAAVENLKIAAQAYNEAGSLKELEQKIATTATTRKEAKQTVRKLENRIKGLAEIIKYAEQYKANNAYHTAYKKSKTLMLISVSMRARSSFMAAQDVCWSRRKSP